MSHVRTLPQLPQIGLPEHEYRRLIDEAEGYRDHHAREAFKVAKYITRAIAKNRTWPEQEKYFKHALDHHCHARPMADEETLAFYASLAHLVREHAGAAVLKHVSSVDDAFAARQSRGEPRDVVAREARSFFRALIPHHHKPEWLNLDDYEQVKVFEHQWAR
jgi:hypothetical protein